MNPFKYVLFFATLLIAAPLFVTPAYSDTGNIPDEHVITREIKVSAGYQGFSVDDNPNRANEYRSLVSSPTFNLNFFNDNEGKNFRLNVDFLNEDDYQAEMNYSHKGLVRTDFRSERFVHNLDHIPYDNGFTGGEIYPPFPAGAPTRTLTGTPAEGSRPDGAYTDDSSNNILRTYYTDHDPTDRYGLRLDINEAKFRIKHPTYPAHINLSYWRYEKEGKKQLRFVGENCATVCHMQSKTRKVDRVTEEIKVGTDAHIGFFDIVMEYLHRTFRDKEEIERDTFGLHIIDFTRGSSPLEHSEDPDSKLTEFTIKANTAPSGGLVGSASFTIGERVNQSDLTSISPVTAETDYYKTAADVTYTPDQKWTFNLRYRLLDMNSDNADELVSAGISKVNSANPLDVRDSMDLTHAWYEMIVNYRPSNKLTLKGELRRENIERSNTGPEVGHSGFAPTIIINPSWQLPDEEIITKAKIGFNSRLLEKSSLKLSGWIALEHSDDPAYGASYGDSRQLYFASSYNPTPYWGLLANIKLINEKNDEHELHNVDLERERDQQNVSLGGFFSTNEGVSFNLNYGYMHTAIEQDVLFGTGILDSDPSYNQYDYRIPAYDSDFDQTVHTFSAGIAWQALENLACNLEAYHIRSDASFSPYFNTIAGVPVGTGLTPTTTASSTNLEEISKIDIRQNGIKGRVNWQIDEDWSCSIEAAYDKYDDRDSNIYDGSVASTMVTISRVW